MKTPLEFLPPLSSAPETQKATKEKQFQEWYGMMRELGHAIGQRKDGDIQLVKDAAGEWVKYEKLARTWKFDYLKKCLNRK